METINCSEAIEQLLKNLGDPDLDRTGAKAAINHIGACPHCERKMRHFFQLLTRQNPLTCQECQELLPDYVQAEKEGQTSTKQWRSVAYHLKTCSDCAAEYTTLIELLGLAYGERGADPPHYPIPDLSFLRPKPEQDKRAWRLNELGHLIIEFSAELLRALQPPTPQLAYAAPRLKSNKRTLVQFSLKEPAEDMDVTITAEALRDEPQRCTVIVDVDIPSREGWPNLADTEVTLKRNVQELGKQRTDAFGKAVFEGIATDDLATLVFEVAPQP